MKSDPRFATTKRSVDGLLNRARQEISRSQHAVAEGFCKQALDEWRRAAAPRADEGPIVSLYGKCLEAQHKYEEAYELYMQTLDHLSGASYDEIYTSFLYLNERMGTFTKKQNDNLGL